MNARLLVPLLSVGCLLSADIAQADLAPFTLVGTHPRDRELSGERASSEEAQGIAFDGSHWYYANRYRLFRLSPAFRDADRNVNISTLSFLRAHCTHVGGIDVQGGEVFAAIDQCGDHHARVAVFDLDLHFLRSTTLEDASGHRIGSCPWIAIDPLDPDVFYTETGNADRLTIFPRRFDFHATVRAVGTVALDHHPHRILPDYWRQGGAFAPNGLFLLTADDAHDEDSHHTGVWIYQFQRTRGRDVVGTKIGLINVRYDPDNGIAGRDDELEDLTVASIASGAMAGDVHLLKLSNELGEDDVSLLHFAAGDADRDGANDLTDNCIFIANPDQRDRDHDSRGDACDIAGRLPVRPTRPF